MPLSLNTHSRPSPTPPTRGVLALLCLGAALLAWLAGLSAPLGAWSDSPISPLPPPAEAEALPPALAAYPSTGRALWVVGAALAAAVLVPWLTVWVALPPDEVRTDAHDPR
ncbi:MAG: hypothetical protein GX605_02280 [Chloroflexi bacterium]|nr:hypothetical protein [Chloroflexota bacterium]